MKLLKTLPSEIAQPVTKLATLLYSKSRSSAQFEMAQVWKQTSLDLSQLGISMGHMIQFLQQARPVTSERVVTYNLCSTALVLTLGHEGLA